MIDAFTPLGVGSEYSWMRSGWVAGHFLVMGKSERVGMGVSSLGEGWGIVAWVFSRHADGLASA